jgi:poly-gamma-glutamate synthesis protein (capsule biosynthesis protein)
VHQKYQRIILTFLLLTLTGCVLPARLDPAPPAFPTLYEGWKQTITYVPSQGTLTPPPDATIENQTQPSTTPTPTQEEANPTLYLHPGLSPTFLSQLDLTPFNLTRDPSLTNLQLNLAPIKADVDGPIWVYSLVAPFFTTTDYVSLNDLQTLWRGESSGELPFSQLHLTAETLAAQSVLWGEPGENSITVMTQDELAAIAATSEPILAILPFEDLSPRWKVLRVEDQSPIDTHFDPRAYPLSLQIQLAGQDINLALTLPPSNYDPQLRTVLVMTGVTALVRATAYRMALNGNTFPGQDIQTWLTEADLAHISNEVPFAQNCPYPDPVQKDLIFCSAPERIELLEYIGTDIIELSGNHMLDYGVPAMNLTLEMYEERGWETYAGGWDLADAQSPALVTHNGNQLAFLGCNPVGPYRAWATESQPGSAPCGDYAWLVEEIGRLKSEGYLPIVTLQYAEDYTARPSAQMIADFQRLADAGTVVVNGSQAHTPKIMTFYNESFLHYGLGNLFFDQMEVYSGDVLLSGTRDEFLDRLVFYDGDLLSVELLTTKLEDYARPRPMTRAEREAFLSRIFSLAIDYLE